MTFPGDGPAGVHSVSMKIECAPVRGRISDGKPVPTPDQVRGRRFPENALRQRIMQSHSPGVPLQRSFGGMSRLRLAHLLVIEAPHAGIEAVAGGRRPIRHVEALLRHQEHACARADADRASCQCKTVSGSFAAFVRAVSHDDAVADKLHQFIKQNVDEAFPAHLRRWLMKTAPAPKARACFR